MSLICEQVMELPMRHGAAAAAYQPEQWSVPVKCGDAEGECLFGMVLLS